MLFLILATAGVAMGSAIPSLVSRATDPTTWPFVLSDAGSVETNLVANLPKVTYTVSNWAGAPALMPDPCVDTNGWAGVDPSKTPLLDICGFQVKSVKFSDCEKPTVVCYHKDAGLTLTEFLDDVSRLPVRARSYVANFIAMPIAYGLAFTVDNVIWGGGRIWDFPGPIMHEISHVFDNHVFGGFSTQANFTAAHAADAVWATQYGKDNGIGEEFAEVGRLSATAYNVPGGLPASVTSKIPHKLASFAGAVGNRWKKGGTCIVADVPPSRPGKVSNCPA